MRTYVAILTVVMLLALVTTLGAEPRTKPSLSFFTGGNGTAGWMAGDSYGGGDNMAVALSVPGFSPPDYAGIFFHRAGGAPPTDPPSFWFKSSVANSSSGGSPRLVMLFSDGGTGELRPLSWTGDWQPVDGATTDWDNNGGTCGFHYEVDYADVLGCHSAAFVIAVFIVTDSGWLVAPYTHLIDDISLYGYTFMSPKDNANQ